MKDIRPALRTFLLSDATVNSLVGGERIHHIRLPQDQLEPSVVYNKVSELAQYNMEGDSGMLQTRMQFDAWAQTASQATELANAVYDKLTGAKGAMPGNNETVNVRGIFSFNGRDDFDEIAKLYRVSRDYMVWYGASE